MPLFRTRPRALAGFLFLATLVPLGVGCGSSDSGSDPATHPQDVPLPTDAERERIEKGLTVSPVAINLTGLDRDLVGLGSYIVNAQGGCNDCHTNPPYTTGGDPFKGQPTQINTASYLAGGMVFPGGVTSTNITPDTMGMPAGLTVDEFLGVLRTGKADGNLLQVMPWPIYSNMSERDMRAIYEYLRSIPHAEPGSSTMP
ncbi:cytochrome C [Corallococcus sp. H22C18031201]|nr:cytochrome C [Corallococcus sp. H22C18031201]